METVERIATETGNGATLLQLNTHRHVPINAKTMSHDFQRAYADH
jgi:hypothetical protein